MRWFADNSHRFTKHDWSLKLIGRLLDTLCDAVKKHKACSSNVVNEEFVMGVFKHHENKVMSFKEHK